jgi:superfamily I DNA and/or RNA helicase
MNNLSTKQLDEYLKDLSSFSSADVLVDLNKKIKSVWKYEAALNFDENDLINFQVDANSNLNQIVKIANENHKKADVQSLCLVKSCIRWNYKGKELISPLILYPLSFKFNKLNNQFYFSLNKLNFFINPFIIKVFIEEFDVDIAVFKKLEETKLLSDFIEYFNNTNLHLFVEHELFIGNFHYHRYEILKDLEEIKLHNEINPLVNKLLGDESAIESKEYQFDDKNCFHFDTDQKEILKALQNTNCVVQGPPGTGKSLLLSNLIAKLLKTKTTNLLVSEKKTALKVIEENLKTKNLHYFILNITSNTKPSEIISSLKKTWRFLEEIQRKDNHSQFISKDFINELQLLFDKMNQNQVIKDFSLTYFINFEQSIEYDDIIMPENYLDYLEWIKIKDNVINIFNNSSKTKLFSKVNFHQVKSPFELTKKINKTKLLVDEVFLLFNAKSVKDINNLIRLSINLQLFDNEEGKKYIDILKSKTNQIKFNRLKKKYLQLLNKLEQLKKETENWNDLPSLSEVQTWLLTLKSKNYFKKYALKNIIKKKFNKNLNVLITIQNIQEYLLIQKTKFNIENEFIELGIESPEQNLTFISSYIEKINQIKSSDKQEIEKLNEILRKNILINTQLLRQLNEDLKVNYYIKEEDDLVSLFQNLNHSIGEISQNLSFLKPIQTNFLLLFDTCSDFSSMEKVVLKSNWIKIKSLYPNISKIDAKIFKDKLNYIINLEEAEQSFFAEEIIQFKKKQFDYFHSILCSESSKLNGETKLLKKQLKIGKSILIREFSKTKQHKSIRELYNSEAGIWIELLSPVILTTPTAVSKNISINKKFDFVLFDEASQLSLVRALASVQRAKRILILGDEQQMSPFNFFSTLKNNHSLLHQASFYFKNMMLTHHYRSENEQLIYFSNRYFYENKLLVYPSPSIENAIEINYLKNGVFEDRTNKEEALELVKKLEDVIDINKSIGIVAFSEQQMNLIWKIIPDELKRKCLTKIENNTLFFKTLEQVQGEEADLLLISLAYGKNKDGVFYKRFGPLNYENGGKRLNVLFTRAKQKIILFTSIDSKDLDFSTNNSINLLRYFLMNAEKNENKSKKIFPKNAKVSINDNELIVHQIYKNIKSIDELLTFHLILSKRKWQVNYEI